MRFKKTAINLAIGIACSSGVVSPTNAQEAESEAQSSSSDKLALMVVGNDKQASQSKGKTLIVFFSQTGHTRAVSEAIQEITGGDVFELVAKEPYPDDYRAIRVRAKAEQENDTRPALKFLPASIAQYDTIFVGSPIWNHTIAQPLATFLGEFDFTDKVLIPFCTHGGGGAGKSEADVRRRAPGAKVLNGYSSVGNHIDKQAIQVWLHKQKTD